MSDWTWDMKGMEWDDPFRICSWQELVNWVNEVGFLPLFANDVPGFSAQEHVYRWSWWTGDREQDPWEWRELIAHSRQGREYGMAVSVLQPPEAVWGYEAVTRWYSEPPAVSWEHIVNRVRECFPGAKEQDVIQLIGRKPK